MEIKRISLPFEVKEVSEDGTFSGVASVYGVEDLGGDIIEKGAFKKTLAENPTIPVLWQHDQTEVIGQGEVKEWQNKILLNGKLDNEDPVAQKAYRKLKNGLIKGLSIGFQAIKSTWEEIEEAGRRRYIRHIHELKLWEVSVVTFPMQPAAQVTRVKSADEEQLSARVESLESELRALQAKQAVTPSPEPTQAVEPQSQDKQESVPDHSASLGLITGMRSLLASRSYPESTTTAVRQEEKSWNSKPN